MVGVDDACLLHLADVLAGFLINDVVDDSDNVVAQGSLNGGLAELVATLSLLCVAVLARIQGLGCNSVC